MSPLHLHLVGMLYLFGLATIVNVIKEICVQCCAHVSNDAGII